VDLSSLMLHFIIKRTPASTDFPDLFFQSIPVLVETLIASLAYSLGPYLVELSLSNGNIQTNGQ